MDAVAEEALLGKFFDEDDLGVNENGGLTFFVGDGDFDEGLRIVVRAALEAEAAFGHVLALDDVVAAFGMADAGGIVDFDARVLAAVGARSGWFFGSGRRQGEDGGALRGLRSGWRGSCVSRGTVGLSVERSWSGRRNGCKCRRRRGSGNWI